MLILIDAAVHGIGLEAVPADLGAGEAAPAIDTNPITKADNTSNDDYPRDKFPFGSTRQVRAGVISRCRLGEGRFEQDQFSPG